jgi:circadian clock protein KaiC
MVGSLDRCKTGIAGFDKLCEGGFVRNSVNVILGGPGAGKTTFLMQFLWNGVNDFNENGAYVSFEPDVLDLMEDAKTYGWNFAKLDAKGKCKFIRLSPKTTISELKTQFTDIVSKYDIQRLCIDPISVLSMNLDKESQIRETIFDLTSLLKRLKVTVLVAEETDEGDTSSASLGTGIDRTHLVKFLSDGVVNFYSVGLGGATDRALRVSKMRRTDQVRGPVPFKISGKGIEVVNK